MGNCTFCGDSAGFFKKSHKECKQRHNQGKEKIISLIGSVGSGGGDLKQLETYIKQIVSFSYIDATSINNIITTGWEKAVDIAFDDGILSEEEEASLIKLKNYFSLSQQELDENGAFTKILKGSISARYS